MIAKSLKLFCV